jgi:hypothetical protein
MFTISTIGMLRPSFFEDWRTLYIRWQPALLFSVLLFIWFFTAMRLHKIDPTSSLIDQGIWLMVILSLISFLLILALCWWLLQHFWLIMGLPGLSSIFSNFNTLSSWQQLGFSWASFFMLLLAASECLKALC